MVAVNYLWNPLNDNIVREFDDARAVVAEYTTEPEQFGNVVSQRRDGEDDYFHFDGVGSTLAVTNHGGTVTDTRAYTAFGEITEQIGITTFHFQYVGRHEYTTELSAADRYVRRRIYSSRDARWLSIDPFTSQQSVQYASQYNYVFNSPYRYIDPSGLLPQLWPPIMGFPLAFRYGLYCGYNARGPGIAIDCVDAACEQHDIALSTWFSCNPVNLKVQNIILCYTISRCIHPLFPSAQSCYSEPTPKRVAACLAAGTAIAEWACLAAAVLP